MRKLLRLKQHEEAKSINKLIIKNRKRLKELNETLEMKNRRRMLQKKDFESYRAEKRFFGVVKSDENKPEVKKKKPVQIS